MRFIDLLNGWGQLNFFASGCGFIVFLLCFLFGFPFIALLCFLGFGVNLLFGVQKLNEKISEVKA